MSSDNKIFKVSDDWSKIGLVNKEVTKKNTKHLYKTMMLFGQLKESVLTGLSPTLKLKM